VLLYFGYNAVIPASCCSSDSSVGTFATNSSRCSYIGILSTADVRKKHRSVCVCAVRECFARYTAMATLCIKKLPQCTMHSVVIKPSTRTPSVFKLERTQRASLSGHRTHSNSQCGAKHTFLTIHLCCITMLLLLVVTAACQHCIKCIYWYYWC
jgi:hypothetical protein